MGKQLSEETKRKRAETFKKKRYEKAAKEIGNKYNHLTILSINKERTEEEYAKGNYYASFGYNDSKGNAVGNYYKRFSFNHIFYCETCYCK